MKIREAFTFDDVLLEPAESSVLPSDTQLTTRITKNIELSIPLVSAAMDTVTESNMAIAMALAGGMGVIHRNLDIDTQAEEVKKVKQSKLGKSKKSKKNKTSSLDSEGRLRVAAATTVGDKGFERALALIDAETDVIVVDTAHGHSTQVPKIIDRIKNRSNSIQIVAGNVATKEATRSLIDSGADCIKVGIGPGSICTTRIIAGVGIPQLTAIMDCIEEAKNSDVTVIADGGIKYSGDFAKSIAAGADIAMIGSLLAGTDETPGEVFLHQGRQFKSYRGMGSVAAMAEGSADRYFQSDMGDTEKLVPEGIEGQVPYIGSVNDVIYQLIGGLRAAMGYTGCKDISEFQNNTRFVKISPASLHESHIHDVFVTRGAPNYPSRG
ncbi:MAG: guanosine monophosphate reductase [Rhodobiaceae bacterium]|nr:guanosine monophosphate reductase [Rhodobiaceae bacterium]|tara:strand:- start:1274 stop:2416 length:1143 start_codon:yes stop_codon:yes gene_type:complete